MTPAIEPRRSCPRITRRAVAGSAALALVALLGGCGIKSDSVVASGATSAPFAASTTLTPTTAATTTTEGGAFTLPSIPADQRVTTPPATSATASVPTTSGAGRRTPGGLTIASFSTELAAQTKLTAPQAQCVAEDAFARFTDTELDKIYRANNSSELDPALVSAFTSIVSSCVARN